MGRSSLIVADLHERLVQKRIFVIGIKRQRARYFLGSRTALLRLGSSDIGGQVDYKFSAWIKSIDFERATKLPDS
jgi:hypothetical protein